MKTYNLKLWMVQTFGGQIIEDQQPEQITIVCDTPEQKKELHTKAKRRNLWDATARYYTTEAAARDAIRWALYN